MDNLQYEWEYKDQEYKELGLKEVLCIFIPFEYDYGLDCHVFKILYVFTLT